MIDRAHDLPITKQAEVLRISRSSVYYLPRPVPEADLADHAASRPAASGVSRSPARGCCAACWWPRGARSAAGT